MAAFRLLELNFLSRILDDITAWWGETLVGCWIAGCYQGQHGREWILGAVPVPKFVPRQAPGWMVGWTRVLGRWRVQHGGALPPAGR